MSEIFLDIALAMQVELEMSGFSTAAKVVAKKQQLFRSQVVESQVICLEGILMGVRDESGKTIPVLTSEKRQRVVTAIIKAGGFKVRA